MKIQYNRQRFVTTITDTNRRSIYSFIKTYLTQYDYSKKIPSYQRGDNDDLYEIKSVFAVIAKGMVYLPIAFKRSSLHILRHVGLR